MATRRDGVAAGLGTVEIRRGVWTSTRVRANVRGEPTGSCSGGELARDERGEADGSRFDRFLRRSLLAVAPTGSGESWEMASASSAVGQERDAPYKRFLPSSEPFSLSPSLLACHTDSPSPRRHSPTSPSTQSLSTPSVSPPTNSSTSPTFSRVAPPATSSSPSSSQPASPRPLPPIYGSLASPLDGCCGKGCSQRLSRLRFCLPSERPVR